MNLIIFITLVILTNSALIGIDFGSEFIKVALLGSGKTFVIIENTTSKRKTENVISF